MPNKPENKRAQEGKGAPALLYTRNETAEYLSHNASDPKKILKHIFTKLL